MLASIIKFHVLIHKHKFNTNMYESYDPEESLLCPKKVTNVMKLDILLSSELGKKIFYSSKGSLVASSSKKFVKGSAKTPSLSCIRPSISFISQSRKTPVPINLTPTREHRKNMKNDIDQEHQKIAHISNKMKDLESKLSENMKKLEGPLTSNQRKNVFEEIKKTNSQYKSLKDNRLTTIKRHRIINNEYKEGIPGFEVYSWQEDKKHYKKVNKSHLHFENRRNSNH